MTRPEYVIETERLTKEFDGHPAVRRLGLRVRPNSIYGFLGPNGAGKTTTMKMLLGLLRPTAGSARVFGLDIKRDSEEIRARLGYLPQDPRFYEHMTARETLRFAAGFFYKGPAAAVEARVAEMLELVGLADKADRRIKGFSGGERQRLGIAQAQVNKPVLLLLDEPAASLDPLGRRDVLAILERLRETTTVLYSTHILDDVQRISDSVGILDHGVLVADGTIDELLAGGTSYLVRVSGDADRAAEMLRALPWVTEVGVAGSPEVAELTVAVSDADAAERELLRTLAGEEQVTVTEFRKRTADLEDVFVQIVEGGRRDDA